jgi:membrane protease YdiL (CAAX protease family)
MCFLAGALGMPGRTAQGLLLRSRQYYRLARGVDPTSTRAALSLGLVERAMGRQDVGNRMIFRALRQGSLPAEEADAIRALVLSRHADPAVAVTAQRSLGDSGPIPLFFADVYQRMGRADLADRETKKAEERGLALVPALIGLLIVCGLILACGAAGLVVGGIALARQLARRAPCRAGVPLGEPSGQPTPAAPAWAAREAVEAIIIFIFVQMAVGLVGAAAFGGSSADKVLTRALATVSSGVCALLWVRLISLRRHGREASATPRGVEFGWRFSRWWRQAAVGVAAAGVAALPLMGLGQLLRWLFGDNPAHDPIKALLVSPPGLPSIAAIILLVCVVVPVLEETLFRGVLYRALRRQWPFLPAAMGSGLVFAAGHLSAGAFPPMLILGILLAYLYERSGSLLAPAVAHGAFNAFNLAIMLAVFG